MKSSGCDVAAVASVARQPELMLAYRTPDSDVALAKALLLKEVAAAGGLAVNFQAGCSENTATQ